VWVQQNKATHTFENGVFVAYVVLNFSRDADLAKSPRIETKKSDLGTTKKSSYFSGSKDQSQFGHFFENSVSIVC